jgi:nickel-dependent lactate racemase
MNRKYEIPYGRSTISFELPADWHAQELRPKDVPAVTDPLAEVTRALRSPFGKPLSVAPFQGDGTVAIAVNDKTRPVPHAILLPPLIDMLRRMGIQDRNITFVIATGTHPVMPREEYGAILPSEIVERFRVVCHDAYDSSALVSRGRTFRGTPALYNRVFAEADIRIVVGNIEPHQFMGYSGGVKSAAIGVAGAETVDRNHALMTDSRAALGVYEDNPARQDVEELGRLLGVHFALNAVLNGHKQIVRALAGDPVSVMEAGIPLVREQFELRVDAPFDLVIASPGGHPKDINLYQAQKALAHATLVVREGGFIILAAACPEGSGSSKYEEWVTSRHSHEDVLRSFAAEGFHVGPHKAFQISRDALHAHLYFVSEMSVEESRSYLLDPEKSVQTAISRVEKEKLLQPGARVCVMPYANATIPRIVSKDTIEGESGAGPTAASKQRHT